MRITSPSAIAKAVVGVFGWTWFALDGVMTEPLALVRVSLGLPQRSGGSGRLDEQGFWIHAAMSVSGESAA